MPGLLQWSPGWMGPDLWESDANGGGPPSMGMLNSDASSTAAWEGPLPCSPQSTWIPGVETCLGSHALPGWQGSGSSHPRLPSTHRPCR